MSATWRRSAAQEDFQDRTSSFAEEVPTERESLLLDATRDLLEFATTVKITGDIIAAFGAAWHEADEVGTHVPGARRNAGLRAAFEAAGFEVTE